jgi:hypothetical protein
MERSQPVELSPQEAMALVQISNAGGIRAGSVSESDLCRIHSALLSNGGYQWVSLL